MNTATKHTPGPWTVDELLAEGRPVVSGSNGEPVALVFPSVYDDEEAGPEAAANAARIALAVNCHDDLVAALRLCMSHNSDMSTDDYNAVQALIAKAEGGAR
jgi:hypothetical protein